MITTTTYATVTINGGDYGSGYDHDNIDIGVGGKKRDISHWYRHIHIGNSQDGFTEEFLSDKLTGYIREASVQFVLQGAVDAEDYICTIKEFL